MARAILEVGPGGDVDADAHLTRADYSYVPGLKRTVSIWLRLYERAQRGEIGGQHDGATRVVARAPVAPASTAA